MGHAYVVIIIFFVQLQVFRELSHLFEAGAGKSSSSHSHSHSEAYIAAKEKKRIELVRYSRIMQVFSPIAARTILLISSWRTAHGISLPFSIISSTAK